MPDMDDNNALVKMRTLRAALAGIGRSLPKMGPGLGMRRGKDGEPIWAVDVSSLPLSLDVSADGRVRGGTILGVVPTIGGDPINGPFAPLSIGAGTVHVVVTILSTPDTTTLAGRVFYHPGIVPTSVYIAVGADPGGAGLQSASGTFKFLLASFVDGEKTLQAGHGPIYGMVQDNLDGSGVGTLQLSWGGG